MIYPRSDPGPSSLPTPFRRSPKARRATAPLIRATVEALEDRTLLVSQFVDLLPLRFFGDFSQVGNRYSASGKVELGFVPDGAETFQALAEIDGSLNFTVATVDPTFTVTSGTLAAPSGASPVPLWTTTTPFDFDVDDLVAGGVAPATGGQTFSVEEGALFTPTNVRLSDADAEVQLQGNLTLSSFTGLSVPVGGDGVYVAIDQGGPSLKGFTTSVTTGFTVLGLTIQPTSLSVTYANADSGPQFQFSGGFEVTTADNGLDGVASNFGPADDPGLIYAGGLVTQASFDLPQAFELFQLPLTQSPGTSFQLVLMDGQFGAYGGVLFPVPGDVAQHTGRHGGHGGQSRAGDRQWQVHDGRPDGRAAGELRDLRPPGAGGKPEAEL